MKRIFFPFFALLAFAFVNSYAQQTFSFDDLIKLRRVGDPQLSPDGKTVAFSIGDVDKAANRTLTQIYTIWVDGGLARVSTRRASTTPQTARTSARSR